MSSKAAPWTRWSLGLALTLVLFGAAVFSIEQGVPAAAANTLARQKLLVKSV
jgi:hypothetical protein